MDTNLLYALIGAHVLLAFVAWFVVYSRGRHQKDIRRTSIMAHEPHSESRAG